jgi:hypothetical protein
MARALTGRSAACAPEEATATLPAVANKNPLYFFVIVALKKCPHRMLSDAQTGAIFDYDPGHFEHIRTVSSIDSTVIPCHAPFISVSLLRESHAHFRSDSTAFFGVEPRGPTLRGLCSANPLRMSAPSRFALRATI